MVNLCKKKKREKGEKKRERGKERERKIGDTIDRSTYIVKKKKKKRRKKEKEKKKKHRKVLTYIYYIPFS